MPTLEYRVGHELSRGERRISRGGSGRLGRQQWPELQECNGKDGEGRAGDYASDSQEALSELHTPVRSSSKDRSGARGLEMGLSLPLS